MKFSQDAHAAAILVAAGSGERLGADKPKALVPVGGVPLVVWAAQALVDATVLSSIVITAPPDRVDEFTTLVVDHFGPHTGVDFIVVPGGTTRQQSVESGLATLPERIQTVLVHDAARAFVPVDQVQRVYEALRDGDVAVIPALPVVDTIKEVTDSGAGEHVVGTPDRSILRAVQTPQGFKRDVLNRAHAEGHALPGGATDDAALAESIGVPVRVVPGDERALKITTPGDLARMEDAVRQTENAGDEAERSASFMVPRTGIGTDVHPISADTGKELAVAGLTWPNYPALEGHSDGDVVAHAMCDALLSAAGMGDMGTNFGTSSPQWAGSSGVEFLKETVRRIQAASFVVGNVAVQLIGPFPRLGERREEAQQVLQDAVDAPVSLSATSTDSLGFVGRREGLAAIATALILPV